MRIRRNFALSCALPKAAIASTEAPVLVFRTPDEALAAGYAPVEFDSLAKLQGMTRHQRRAWKARQRSKR